MTTVKFRTAVIPEDVRERAFKALLVLFVASLSMFLYYFGLTMYDAAYVTSHQSRVSDFHASIADKESAYLALANKLTIEKAYEMGLVDVPASGIIAISSGSNSLSINSSVGADR